MSRISTGVIILLVTPIWLCGAIFRSILRGPSIDSGDPREINVYQTTPAIRRPSVRRKSSSDCRKVWKGPHKTSFSHEAFQDLKIGRIGDQREAVIEEYEKLLANYPHSAAFLYLAAHAEYSRNTKRAIEDLEQALLLAPKFGLPHLLLAEIYSASAFSDPAKVTQHLDRFFRSLPVECPHFPGFAMEQGPGTDQPDCNARSQSTRRPNRCGGGSDIPDSMDFGGSFREVRQPGRESEANFAGCGLAAR